LEIFLAIIRSWVQSKARNSAEILSLQHQLSVYKRQSARPKIEIFDKLIFILLRKIFGGWKESLIIVSPDTVIKWHRQCSKEFWNFLSSINRKPGRPKIVSEIVTLIRNLANENPIWGASRIHGELLQLGFNVSERTIARYLIERPKDRRRQQSWQTFLNNHASEICSMDFFTEFTVGFRQIYGFVIVEHGRRTIIHTATTFSPTKEWIIQQLCNALPGDCPYRHLICDNDKKFGKYLRKEARDLFELEVKQTSFRSPWQNGICERTIGTIRQELLNHIIPFSQNHLASQLSQYREYFNNDRTHRTLRKDSPVSRVNSSNRSVELLSKPRVGGLHNRYDWDSAA
jgi:transposase InsO family protein